MSVCPTCEREFDSTRSMKYHHNYAHGESIAGVEIVCDNCGNTTTRNPAKIKNQDKVYCSRQCQYADRTELDKAKLYELYWGEHMSTGEIADEEDTSPQVVQRRMREYGIPVKNGHSHSAWVFQMLPRSVLHKEYVRRNKSTYTLADEYDVSLEFVRQHLHEIDIPVRTRWVRPTDRDLVREDYDYGPNWREIRKKVLKRYNHTCQGCGEKADKLCVHHIIPFRTFDDREKANELDNLVPYCPTCHYKWERIPVRPVV